jgi:hypothetical protein
MKQKARMTLYVIDALDLESRDLMKNSDPYLVIKMGN